MMTPHVPPQASTTARQWELQYGDAAVVWMHSSGVAARMLDDVTLAVERVVDWFIQDDPVRARLCLEQFPQALAKCDELPFEDHMQALAYLILHLPDRYCRMWQVLERLLMLGRLPLGKSSTFAVLDIGAGPGPGVFAVRSFYAALAHYTRHHHPVFPTVPLGHCGIVERSGGMTSVMHIFAEALIEAEGLISGPRPRDDRPSHPCLDELKASAIPFRSTHSDFTSLDVPREHREARRQYARWLYNDEDSQLSWSAALQLAHEGSIEAPSSYALVLMLNFLTTTSSLDVFDDALQRLMRGALVPGGTIAVLGATGAQYPAIYEHLDTQARTAHLRVLADFEEPLPATRSIEQTRRIGEFIRRMWLKLETFAGDVQSIKDTLRAWGADDIFDLDKEFTLPRLRVRVYRRGA